MASSHPYLRIKQQARVGWVFFLGGGFPGFFFEMAMYYAYRYMDTLTPDDVLRVRLSKAKKVKLCVVHQCEHRHGNKKVFWSKIGSYRQGAAGPATDRGWTGCVVPRGYRSGRNWNR